MSWLEIEIRTTAEAKEAVTNILYEVDVQGIVIEDPNDIMNKIRDEDNWDYIDSSLIENYYEGVLIKGYFEKNEFIDEKIKTIKEKIHMLPLYDLNIGSGDVSTSELEDRDWNSEWKKYFKPTRIGNKIVIKPTWEEYKEKEDDVIINIDPGLAFGTGTHETTSMCIEEIEKYANEDSVVFDIGTGTGILSIVSAKLGCKEIIGVDSDENCVVTARENIKENQVDDKINIIKGNLLDSINTKANLIVANVVADVIIGISDYISEYVYDEGIFISSGILTERATEVENALKNNNFEIISISKKDVWACITAKKGVS